MLYPNNIPKRESVKEWISMLWDEFKNVVFELKVLCHFCFICFVLSLLF